MGEPRADLRARYRARAQSATACQSCSPCKRAIDEVDDRRAAAMNARMNCDVATAKSIGMRKSTIIAGTWITPPPTPNRLDTKPTAMLSTTPCQTL